MHSTALCDCTLCQLEAKLISFLANKQATTLDLFSSMPHLQRYGSASDLISCLRTSQSTADSDGIFRDLLLLRPMDSEFVESVLILVFLPMLHRTVRMVRQQQQFLMEEDISQQSLATLLYVVCSRAIQIRTSHFAFAIAREFKRSVFAWAYHESIRTSSPYCTNLEALEAMQAENTFESYAQLRHFIHKCVTKRLISQSELDLLIQFKLDGTSGRELAALNGSSPNAVRQRFKRLLAKLKQIGSRGTRGIPSEYPWK